MISKLTSRRTSLAADTTQRDEPTDTRATRRRRRGPGSVAGRDAVGPIRPKDGEDAAIVRFSGPMRPGGGRGGPIPDWDRRRDDDRRRRSRDAARPGGPRHMATLVKDGLAMRLTRLANRLTLASAALV